MYPGVTVLPWYYVQRTNSLRFFSSRGHQQVMAAYYDGAPSTVTNWLNAGAAVPGIRGVMYTTWQSSYDNLEAFSAFVSDWEIQNSWQLGASLDARGLHLELPAQSNSAYTVWWSPDLKGWQSSTSFTATAAIARCLDTNNFNRPAGFYRVSSP